MKLAAEKSVSEKHQAERAGMLEKEVLILNFHGLGRPDRDLAKGEDDFWLEPLFFESILDFAMSRPSVRVTFDDSNSSDFEIAFPALIRRNIKATFFIVSDRIDSGGFLTSWQVREMVRAGMRIGSHGRKHCRWTQLSMAELDEDLNISRRTLEDLTKQTVDEAACPFGSYNRRVLSGLRAAGYTRVYTSDDGPARLDDWVLARNTIERRHDISHVEGLLEPKDCLSKLYHELKVKLRRLR